MSENYLIASEVLAIRATAEADLNFVVELENAADNRQFIGHWQYEDHLRALSDPDIRHLILENQPAGQPVGQLVGYVIITGLNDIDQSINLKRIAIAQKGHGYGHEAIQLLQKLAFETWLAHRFWLDVKDYNLRAKHLYETEGFVVEGTLREAHKTPSGYESMIIMSILRSEYETK